MNVFTLWKTKHQKVVDKGKVILRNFSSVFFSSTKKLKAPKGTLDRDGHVERSSSIQF